MVELINLDEIIIKEKPRKHKTQAMALMKEDNAVCQLWNTAKKKGRTYRSAVKNYLEVYASYKFYNKPRQLITDLEKILKGILLVEKYPEEFLARVIKHRNSQEYNGSWDKMLEDFEKKRKERQLYKCVDAIASEEEDRKIRELKKIEEENKIDFADYCLAL